MEGGLIPEPQKTHLLELRAALGPATNEFALVGGKSLKLVLSGTRATRDFDFSFMRSPLREKPTDVAEHLAALQYKVVPESRNFQFQKSIPSTNEVMRIEFMVPRKLKRYKDFRVVIGKSLHARECLGGAIALRESDCHEVRGGQMGHLQAPGFVSCGPTRLCSSSRSRSMTGTEIQMAGTRRTRSQQSHASCVAPGGRSVARGQRLALGS